MRRVAADFGPIPEYAGESLDRVAKLTEADYPLDGKDFAFSAELGGHRHRFRTRVRVQVRSKSRSGYGLIQNHKFPGSNDLRMGPDENEMPKSWNLP